MWQLEKERKRCRGEGVVCERVVNSGVWCGQWRYAEGRSWRKILVVGGVRVAPIRRPERSLAMVASDKSLYLSKRVANKLYFNSSSTLECVVAVGRTASCVAGCRVLGGLQ